jgi:NADH dehydrogenase (ubiquinone) 1 alpha/beta subcomplex 1, acyl-carrier protein
MNLASHISDLIHLNFVFAAIIIIIMFSAGRVLASRVVLRAVAPKTAFSALRQPQYVRTFAAQTFLDAADVTERIITVVKNFDQVDGNKVTPKVKFTEDLGLDSLDVVEVVMAIEDEFAIEIPDAEADKISSIEEAVEYITSHPMAK